MAGMVASQCGIPLFSPSHANGMSRIDKFLVGLICLGDILNEQGYHLVYYGGDSLSFAGKGKFYATHKFNEIYGKEELTPKLTGYRRLSSWGLFDDNLFRIAYDKFLELSNSKQKFAFFLSTADTHFPRGIPSPVCNHRYQDGINPMLNVVACADHLISEFIKRIINSPKGRETIIVLISDHLSMRNTASDLLEKNERRNLFMILDPENTKAVEISKAGSALDVASTILPFIGYSGTVGLGRNLLDDDPLVLTDIDYIHKNLDRWIPDVYRLWEFPKIQHSVHVNSRKPEITIDDRTFGIPVLVEVDNNLQTVLRFPEPWNVKGLRLIDYWQELVNKKSLFIWVDECRNVSNFDASFNQGQLCFMMGKGDQFFIKIPVNDDVKLTREQITRFL